VKEKLLQMLTNVGQPIILVDDGNFENRGELLLVHKHDGIDLKTDYAKDTLRNMQTLWRRPVNLVTKVDGRGIIYSYDGREQTEKKIEL
jgi:stage V sporulation protein R